MVYVYVNTGLVGVLNCIYRFALKYTESVR